MKATDATGQFVIGFNIKLGNGKIVTMFDGHSITLQEATDIWNEVNSDDYERLSVYQLTKVNPTKF
jgi:hypothetical protein